MIKKIKIVDKCEGADYSHCLRDTTQGKIYDAHFWEAGDVDNEGVQVDKPALSFVDDIGDVVGLYQTNPVYEVVEEDQPTTNNNQVNWDEIPEDVEAVVTFEYEEPSYYKNWNGNLHVQKYRDDSFEESIFMDLCRVEEQFGERSHLHPSPITEPTPEPPESTQVETSEVGATTTPEFDWSSVDADVEAVFLHGEGRGQWQQWYKTVDGNVMVRYSPEVIYKESGYNSIQERVNDAISSGAEFHVRPPAITPPEDMGFEEVKGSTDLRLKCRAAILSNSPSISTILQEAQQSILKHHGVTGKVAFISHIS